MDGHQQFLLGGIAPSIRNRYGHISSRIPVRPILASAVALVALAIGGNYLVTYFYGSHSQPSASALAATPATPEELAEPASGAAPEEPVGGGNEAEPELVKTPTDEGAPNPVRSEPVESVVSEPETADIDPDTILKGIPVVRKAEPVEEGEEAEAPAEEDSEPESATPPSSV